MGTPEAQNVPDSLECPASALAHTIPSANEGHQIRLLSARAACMYAAAWSKPIKIAPILGSAGGFKKVSSALSTMNVYFVSKIQGEIACGKKSPLCS